MSKIEKPECTSCGKEKRPSEYYQSQSNLYKYHKILPVCKSCIEDIYNQYKDKYENDRDVIYYFCRKLDLPYTDAAYTGAVQNSEKTGWKLYQSYFKQINSFGDINNHGMSFDDSEPLLSITTTNYNTDNISSPIEDKQEQHIIDEGFEITQDIISFWGKGFKSHEYAYLENFYTDFVTSYECDSPAQVLLFKNAAKTQLNADKALAEGNVNLYDKLMKTLSTILGDSNIKPVQETGANATEQATFGTLIKKWENDKPIPEPLDEWKMSNWIRYIRIWFFGHLAKMTGTNSPYESEYQAEMKKFKVEINPDTSEGD